MKFTLSWLKTHLETDAELDEIVQRLTMLGLEVDGVTDRSAELAPFKIGHVLSAEPHPNADKLRVCRVDLGDHTLQVVCGAPNARAGLKVVFAPAGATIPRTGLVLKPSVIRGVDSNGMLCSGYELGITEDRDGIVELAADAPVGVGFATFAGLDDPLLDVKITANRADCLGVRGIARDLAASGLGSLIPLQTRTHPGQFDDPRRIHIEDPHACPLFVARTIRRVRNGPSPQWLQDRLVSIGVRPISALVDITNFMTFDLARPLHVFDAAKLSGDLVIRSAIDGESLEALNGKTYPLKPGMTVIADASGPISLAGVIGGASTGCSEATTDIVIEAALFDPVRTAATGRQLNLQSDARYRFERGLDPAFVFDGMERATQLVLEIAGGEAGAIIVAGQERDWQRGLTLRPDRVESLGGLSVPDAEIIRILETLGCTVEPDGTAFQVTVPSWRADIEGEADLIEEILRINGYDHIPVQPLPRDTALPVSALDPGQRRAALVRRVLASRGLDEAVTYSFMPSDVLRIGNGAIFGPSSEALRVANPISADLDVMRPTILPNLLQAAARNADRGYSDLALFEVGPQYRSDAPEGQALVAAGIRVGQFVAKSWNGAGRAVDPFDAKEDAFAALAASGVLVENLQVTTDPPGWYHPGRAGSIRLGPKTVLAHFGEIHPRLRTGLGMKGMAVGFELYLDIIPFAKTKQRPALKLSAFQPVARDFAFIVDQAVTAEQVLRAARGVDRKLISDVRLFDLYTGPGVPEGQKSLAITVTLQPSEATLTEPEIEAFSKALVQQVAKATGGVLRG